MTEVDPLQATAPLAAFCFMTGFMSVCYIYNSNPLLALSSVMRSPSLPFSYGVGFKPETLPRCTSLVCLSKPISNDYQLALALARLFEGPPNHRDSTFHKADQQALCSLLAFNAGTFLGRIGDKIGAQRRIWLIIGSFIATLFTMAAAIAFWKSGQPSLATERAEPAWTNTLTFVGIAFMSASLGVQGILSKRLNTQFGTTSFVIFLFLLSPHLLTTLPLFCPQLY